MSRAIDREPRHIKAQERRGAGDNYVELLRSRGYSWDRLSSFYRDGQTGDLIYRLD